MKTTDDQNELFYWVDENDTVIGSMTRREAHSGSFKIHRGVWVLVFNEKGELFLQKRSRTKDVYPGFWDLSVGGHVRFGQTYVEAAKREFREELGVESNKLLPLYKFKYSGKNESEIDSVYKTIHNGPFTLHPQEIDQGKFFSTSCIEQEVPAAI